MGERDTTIEGTEAIIFFVFVVGFSMGIGSILFDSIRGLLPMWIRPIGLIISSCCGLGLILALILIGYDDHKEKKE